MPSLHSDRQQALRLLAALEALYPDVRCALLFRNPFELLVATILSAQCTDVRVNQVTPGFFARFPDPAAVAAAPLQDIEAAIRSTGFFRNKAKHIQGCAAALLAAHDGQVPHTLEELVALPGVGRKTANVVLGTAFGVPGMVVDTHVNRLANRFGWTRSKDPLRIEQDLCRLLPAERWVPAGHLLIFHGRSLCKAPVPHCSRCPVFEHCRRLGVTRSK